MRPQKSICHIVNIVASVCQTMRFFDRGTIICGWPTDKSTSLYYLRNRFISFINIRYCSLYLIQVKWYCYISVATINYLISVASELTFHILRSTVLNAVVTHFWYLLLSHKSVCLFHIMLEPQTLMFMRLLKD